MKSRKVKNVVLDIGKVIIKYDKEIEFMDIINDDGERRWFMENIWKREWKIEKDRGRRWKEEEEMIMERKKKNKENIRDLRRKWRRMVKNEYEERVEIMRGIIEDGKEVKMIKNLE